MTLRIRVSHMIVNNLAKGGMYFLEIVIGVVSNLLSMTEIIKAYSCSRTSRIVSTH